MSSAAEKQKRVLPLFQYVSFSTKDKFGMRVQRDPRLAGLGVLGRGVLFSCFHEDHLKEATQLYEVLISHNVTVNGDRYRAMITNFFISELNNHDVQELWSQQDGATCHTARATIDLLKDTFGDRLISRFGPVNWPPRSCDLTPLDYFLSGYVKSLVHADKPQTLDHLEDNIRRVIADIRPQMLEKIIENWTSRLDYIRASRGSPMPEIIFKM
ncbi:hemocyanin B chain [Trichonephila clavipes]|nr:hemocyanin B chain [Trichonephila clavipes]